MYYVCMLLANPNQVHTTLTLKRTWLPEPKGHEYNQHHLTCRVVVAAITHGYAHIATDSLTSMQQK